MKKKNSNNKFIIAIILVLVVFALAYILLVQSKGNNNSLPAKIQEEALNFSEGTRVICENSPQYTDISVITKSQAKEFKQNGINNAIALYPSDIQNKLKALNQEVKLELVKVSTDPATFFTTVEVNNSEWEKLDKEKKKTLLSKSYLMLENPAIDDRLLLVTCKDNKPYSDWIGFVRLDEEQKAYSEKFNFEMYFDWKN